MLWIKIYSIENLTDNRIVHEFYTVKGKQLYKILWIITFPMENFVHNKICHRKF